MPKAGKLLPLVVATTINVLAFAPRTTAQTPNVVIQWNQILQALPMPP
jgi:hypothetical protein